MRSIDPDDIRFILGWLRNFFIILTVLAVFQVADRISEGRWVAASLGAVAVLALVVGWWDAGNRLRKYPNPERNVR